MDHFIDDGRNRDGYIAAQPGRYPALRFTYRPATYREKNAYQWNGDRISEEEEINRLTRLFTKRISKWTAGREPTPENILALHPTLIVNLTAIVLGVTPSDRDPLITEEPFRDGSAVVGKIGPQPDSRTGT